MKMYSRTAGKKLMALILCAIMMITMLPPGAKVSQAATSVSNPRTANGVSTWDCIYFGNYYQSNSSTKEPIKWRVLSVEGNEAFVVADMALDCKRYNQTYEDVTWETCTLRQWLNSTFLDAAFNEEEQSAIKMTTVVNDDNNSSGTSDGNTTSDKIFLLSHNEVINPSYGFNSDSYIESETRQCKASAYAIENRCWTTSSDGYAGNCWWWLRSPRDDASHAARVDFDGWGYCYGGVTISYIGVRPALNINLSSSSWKYAGTVSANVGQKTATPIVGVQPTETLKPGEMLSNPRVVNGISTWDSIYFGNYYQSYSSTKEPIKWRVLSVEENEAFVVADMALDCKPYNETYEDVTWETCTLRQWLNSTFLDAAFNEEEQSAIKTTTVVNEDNIDYGVAGGNTTWDKIFLLSQSEVKNPNYGFNSEYSENSETRQCKASAYAVENGCFPGDAGRYAAGYAGNCIWLLRTLGGIVYSATNVSYVGDGTNRGEIVTKGYQGVRPALNINLSSSSWKYAGTVSANIGLKTATPTVTPTPTSEPNATATATPTVTPIIKSTPTPTATATPIVPQIPTSEPNATPTTIPTVTPTIKSTPTSKPTTKPDSTLQQTPNTNVQPSQMPAATLKPTADNRNPAADSTKPTLKKVTAFKAKALKKALKLTWK